MRVEKTEIQWGYREGDGHFSGPVKMDIGDYLTEEEYARLRAEVTGGVALKRTRTIITTDWEEV